MTTNVDTTRLERDIRQGSVLDWVKRCFGIQYASPAERLERIVEEVLELAQIEGLTKARLCEIYDRVNEKPPGVIAQELGGISVTMLGYAECRGLSLDYCESQEVKRVLSKTEAHFRERHQRKLDSGLARSFAA